MTRLERRKAMQKNEQLINLGLLFFIAGLITVLICAGYVVYSTNFAEGYRIIGIYALSIPVVGLILCIIGECRNYKKSL